MTEVDIPTYQDLMLPTLQAINELGGSAAIAELDERAISIAGVTDEQLAVEFPDEAKTSGSKVVNRLYWARSYLKAIGTVDNSRRGVWSLTPTGAGYLAMDARDADAALREAEKAIRAERRRAKASAPAESVDAEDADNQVDSEGVNWNEELLSRLKAMEPTAFERLAMRLLREAGFTNVEVTRMGADEGIDGVGVYKPSLISFPIYFQCKRYKGSVGSGVVRDFRGAMAGRGEKGIVITTGTFTPSARSEATRDGAPPVDLIGGEELCELLKEYRLGVIVQERIVEDVKIDQEFLDRV